MPFDVFISHNFKDKLWVRKLVNLLRLHNLTVFFDEDSIPFGEDIVKSIEKNIENAGKILLIISPASLRSKWVSFESSLAVFSDPDSKKKLIIPILIDGKINKKIRLSLRRLHIVDLTRPEFREQMLRKLFLQLSVDHYESGELSNLLSIDDRPMLGSKPISQSNPYIYGLPLINGQTFVGRKEIISSLFKDIFDRSYGARVSLFGGCNIGTTSILLALANNNIQSAYQVNLQKIKCIYIDLSRVKGDISPETLTNILYEECGNKKENRKSLHLKLEKIEIFINRNTSDGVHTVFLFDRIDNIKKLGHDYFYFDDLLKRLGHRNDNYVSIITASKKPMYEIFENCANKFPHVEEEDDLGNTPFYIHFKPLPVGLFSEDEIDELIISVSEKSGISLKSYKPQILNLSGNFPNFLQLACSLVYSALEKENTITSHSWKKIHSDFNRSAVGFYNYLWNHFTDTDKNIIRDIAYHRIPHDYPVDSAKLYYDTYQDAISDDVESSAEINFTLADFAAYQTNVILRQTINGGDIKHKFPSEWLWSILNRNETGITLFSNHFEQYIRHQFERSDLGN